MPAAEALTKKEVFEMADGRSSSPHYFVHRDVGFHPEYELAEPHDLGIEFQLSRATCEKIRRVRNCLLIALSLAWFVGAWLSYPRNRNVFPAWRRYFDKSFSYGRVMHVIATLEDAGIVDSQRMKPHSRGAFQSRIRLASEISPPLGLLNMRALRQIPSETVRLKDERKSLRTYDDCEFTSAVRRDVLEQNEALESINVRLPAHLLCKDKFGLYRLPETFINPRSERLYRTFNIDWLHGGRWYGGWWQNLPSDLRPSLLIDSRPIVEEDFPTFYPTLIAATAQYDLPHDPYVVPDFDRKTAKRAFNIALNAATKAQAIAAISNELRKLGQSSNHGRCRKLLTQLALRTPFFQPYFGTGVGLRLQRIDADICASVQKLMRAKGIPSLSIHDSFIVPATKKADLLEAMACSLGDTCRQLRRSGLL